MKTHDEIVERFLYLNENAGGDFFGFIRTDIIAALPFSHAKPFLKEDVTEEDWNNSSYVLKSDETIVGKIVEYMPFAWEKANNCRGLSAARSINHMQAWLWLLGEDEASNEIEDYEYYGKPQLAAISEKFGVDWRSLDDGSWRNDEEGMDYTKPFVAELTWRD